MSRVLVTGSTGLLGRAVVPHLAECGHDVHLLARSAADAARIQNSHPNHSVITFESLEAHREGPSFDAIVHLAGRACTAGALDSVADTEIMIASNVEPTRRLVEYAKRTAVPKFVFTSSIFAISANANDAILNDLTPAFPATAYGASKRTAEILVGQLPENGTFAVGLRLPLVVSGHAVGNWMTLQRLAATKLPLPLGAIQNLRSFVSLGTVCETIQHLVDKNWDPSLSGNYGLADAKPLSIKDVVCELRTGMGLPHRLLPVSPRLVRMLGVLLGKKRAAGSLTGNFVIDPSRFFENFSFRPSSDIRKAIQESGRQYLKSRSGKKAQGPGVGNLGRENQSVGKGMSEATLRLQLKEAHGGDYRSRHALVAGTTIGG